LDALDLTTTSENKIEPIMSELKGFHDGKLGLWWEVVCCYACVFVWY
jgi:hypothetical protein